MNSGVIFCLCLVIEPEMITETRVIFDKLIQMRAQEDFINNLSCYTFLGILIQLFLAQNYSYFYMLK
jgi:hypothetical protein